MKTPLQRFVIWREMVWLGMVFLLLVPVVHGQEASSQEPDATPSYEELLERVKSGDRDIDFHQLRFSYEGDGDVTESMGGLYEALNSEKYEKALKLCNGMLKELYISIDAQAICMVAHRELGNAKESEHHSYILDGLMDSIVVGRDGRSPDTAWEVISIPEEYAVMRMLGYRMQGQSLRTDDGHTYDVMTAETSNGEVVEIYFNIDHFFGAPLD